MPLWNILKTFGTIQSWLTKHNVSSLLQKKGPLHRRWGKTDDGLMMSCTNTVSAAFCIGLGDKGVLTVWEISEKGFMVKEHLIGVSNF